MLPPKKLEKGDGGLQVLIVEERAVDFILINTLLQNAFANANVIYCQTLAQASAVSSATRLDVFLLSINLKKTDFDVTAFSKLAKHHEAAIIVLADYPDPAILAELIQLGAQDCLPKEALTSNFLYKSIAFARQRNNRKLLEINELKTYQHIFDQNPLPVFIYQVDNGRIRLSNAAAQRFYGFPADEFLKLPASKLLEAAGENLNVSGIRQHQKSNGVFVEVEVLSRLIKIDNKTCRAVTVIDLSKRPALIAPNENQQQLLLLQAAINDSVDGVIITKNNGENNFLQSEIVYHNAAFTQLSGLISTEITGCKPASLHQKQPVKEAPKADFGTDVYETKLINPAQKLAEIWVHYSLRPVEDQAGQITHFVAVYRDVTSCKNNEIENEQALREMQASNTELKQFAYVISHNLRAPLANLTGLLSLLDTETITDGETLEIIGAIKSSTNNLKVSVNDIIDILLIKIDEENVGEHLNVFSGWLKIKNSLAYLIESAAAIITEDFTESAYIFFKETYLESILLNLLSNALKYKSADRQLIINLKTYPEKEFTVLIFEDNGIGIDLQKYGGQIFGLYRRFTSQAEGKGLGLYIVQTQMAALGGRIEVKSELGRGTRFTLFFKKPPA